MPVIPDESVPGLKRHSAIAGSGDRRGKTRDWESSKW